MPNRSERLTLPGHAGADLGHITGRCPVHRTLVERLGTDTRLGDMGRH